jgi:hypothetical protein
MIEAAQTFLLMCKLLPLTRPAVDMDFERQNVRDYVNDPYYANCIAFVGGEEAFIELKAHIDVVSWLVEERNPNGCPEARDFIYPYFERLAAPCPDLQREWPRYDS